MLARYRSKFVRNSIARSQGGFTLVEMAVVLVVIGVILSAVMIGRDVQRNAEYVKIRQTFVNQWAEAYNAYRQRYGIAVGDSPDHPRNMVNGAAFAGNGTVLSGGDMTRVNAPPAVCSGSKGLGMTRPMQTDIDLNAVMRKAGIELPPGRGTGMEDRYTYQDSNGNPQEIQICFQWNPPGTPSGSGNMMVVSGLTPDLARALAAGLKGVQDANTGTFRQQDISADDLVGGPLDWKVDNTINYAGNAATTREDQVATVVAHYKMNQ